VARAGVGAGAPACAGAAAPAAGQVVLVKR
jgi:hypothetical protein